MKRNPPQDHPSRRLPAQGWLGLALIALFWPLNWLLPGLRTHMLFFPLWLGYILTVDGLVSLRKGTSLLGRSWRRFIGLFFISAPAWWLFELFNKRTQNWRYWGEEQFTGLQFFIFSTISFTIVIPAVFETAELWSAYLRPLRGPTLGPTRRTMNMFFLTGLVMLTLLLIWPRYFFPFLWLSLFFLLEPLNAALGFPTLLTATKEGNWTPVATLGLGALTCGFFWEMWNYFAFPKWTYNIPFVDFARIFEMPLLGYGGYPTFALELYALYNFLTGLAHRVRTDYVQLTRP